MAEVVTFEPPTGNPEVVDHFRTLLGDAQNGRLVSYVIVRVSHAGKVDASFFYDCQAHELALGTVVNFDRLNEHTE